MTFSSVNPFANVMAPSSAYSSDSLSQVTNGHVSTDHNYGVKHERHYL
jgi:hypothetical protein